VQTHPRRFQICGRRIGLFPAHSASSTRKMGWCGYPEDKERDILKHARICAVCDVFDAMTSGRPYMKHPLYAAGVHLGDSGILFDPGYRCVQQCCSPFQWQPVSSLDR
jgi:hypothetical protein